MSVIYSDLAITPIGDLASTVCHRSTTWALSILLSPHVVVSFKSRRVPSLFLFLISSVRHYSDG